MAHTHLGALTCHPTPKALRVKERAPILFFFRCFCLGPTFGLVEKFGGMSNTLLAIELADYGSAMDALIINVSAICVSNNSMGFPFTKNNCIVHANIHG